ncbi:hypothetical protein PG984_015208 [Apiospora sp. TS-2023a]
MFFSRIMTLGAAAVSFAALANAACEDSEAPELFCYTDGDSVPQDVAIADVKYVASYLRSYGQQTKNGRQFVMLEADTPDCGEWSLYQRGSVLATAKHIVPDVNSSVLFTDIANTIDGGVGTKKMQALVDCASAGGSFGVAFNASDPQYNTASYRASGYTPNGILVKIVSSK